MRRGEGLVQVHVDAVKAHVAGADDAHDGVQVGAVVVAQATGLVDKAGDLQNVVVKNAHGVGVGQHQTGGILAQHGTERVQIHAAVRAGGDVHHLIAAHGGGGGVGAVGAVGHDDLGALVVAPGIVVLLDQQHTGKLAVSASSRLEGHVVHAGDLAQVATWRCPAPAARPVGRAAGESGWTAVKPSSAATSSSMRGLYFMVQEPRG